MAVRRPHHHDSLPPLLPAIGTDFESSFCPQIRHRQAASSVVIHKLPLTTKGRPLMQCRCARVEMFDAYVIWKVILFGKKYVGSSSLVDHPILFPFRKEKSAEMNESTYTGSRELSYFRVCLDTLFQ